MGHQQVEKTSTNRTFLLILVTDQEKGGPGHDFPGKEKEINLGGGKDASHTGEK